jgi:glycosyltransferase involved in cell wall biosynthesis
MARRRRPTTADRTQETTDMAERITGDYTLSVVVPVYNEKNFLEELICRVMAVDIRKEIILVDDMSRDGTREILQEIARGERIPSDDRNRIRVFFHQRNQGKGAAVRTGMRQVNGDVVIIQDADLEYDPREYPRILEPILDGRADAVYGSRFLGGGPSRVLFFWHYQANRFLTTVSNMFTDLNMTDMETCYKAFTRQMSDRIVLKSNRFGFDPEITARLAKLKARIYEVPISYSGRDYSEGKKISWRDGFVVLWAIVKYNLLGF